MFYGVVVCKVFVDKYFEVVVVYICVLMEVNDWVCRDFKFVVIKIEEWIKIEKEVVYFFFGFGGIYMLDLSIKLCWIEMIKMVYGVLVKLGWVKDFDVGVWVNECYVCEVFKQCG